MRNRVAGIIGIIITAILLVLYLPPLILYGILDIGNIIGFVVAALVLVFSIQQFIKASAGAAKRSYDRSQAGGTRGKLHHQFNHDMGRNTVLIERGGLGKFTADRSIGYDGDRESHAGAIIWTIIFALIIAFYAQGFGRMYTAGTYADSRSTLSDRSIIVLGCGVRGERPTRMLRERIEAARVALLSDEAAEDMAVVTGGKGAGEDITEACCMQQYLIQQDKANEDSAYFRQACEIHGVDYDKVLSENSGNVPVIDESRILMEAEATNTEENIVNSMQTLSEHGYDSTSLVIVTQRYHIYRADRIAEQNGAEATGYTAPIDWWNEATYATRECASLLYHTIAG